VVSSREDVVLRLLRSKLELCVKNRGRAEFDRRIGRPRTGWTSKFLAGKEYAPSLSGLLRILEELKIHPAAFFEEAFPQENDQPLSSDEARAAYETAKALARRLEEMESRMSALEGGSQKEGSESGPKSRKR
jgi:hypothetical protein